MVGLLMAGQQLIEVVKQLHEGIGSLAERLQILILVRIARILPEGCGRLTAKHM